MDLKNIVILYFRKYWFVGIKQQRVRSSYGVKWSKKCVHVFTDWYSLNLA